MRKRVKIECFKLKNRLYFHFHFKKEHFLLHKAVPIKNCFLEMYDPQSCQPHVLDLSVFESRSFFAKNINSARKLYRQLLDKGFQLPFDKTK